MTEIANPGLPDVDQIEAAKELYCKMPYWQRKDRVLNNLAKQDPDLQDEELTLLKVATINELYGARCSEPDEITDWIVKNKVKARYLCVIQDKDDAYISLVRDIALRGRKPSYGGDVFASKFAHFFIDPHAFPINDSRSMAMLGFHLNKNLVEVPVRRRYKAFYYDYLQLKSGALSRFTYKELDQYLWLANICIKLRQNPRRTNVNHEVKAKFLQNDLEINALFQRLFPPSRYVSLH